ncbi:MAG: response regulator [Gammaproteobacteria bacterium]|nr:response regulator [Gammaproteobacteria bacterium]
MKNLPKTLPRVLVVDDDPVIGKSFDRVLSGKGYAVITAADGEEALRKLKDENYDVVFADIKMPGMNGLEVAERIKASQPWLPVVIVTGYGTEANEMRAEAAGVSGFLRKPLTPDMIEDSTKKALHEKDAVAEPEEQAATAVQPAEKAATVAEPEMNSFALFAKNVALFIASPFIGLAYVIAFPFIGFGMMAWLGVRALKNNHVLRKAFRPVKHVVMLIVAPFIGLAYVVTFPFIGFGMLAWVTANALFRR